MTRSGPEADGIAPVEADAPSASGTLYILAAGVGDFAEPVVQKSMALTNPGRDATAIVELFRAPDKPVYERTVVIELPAPQASRARLLAALREIAKNATPDDMVLIFLAGHGLHIAGQYFFAPYDIGLNAKDAVRRAFLPKAGEDPAEATAEMFRKGGLSQDELLTVVQSIKAARVSLILDSCYSGNLASDDAVRLDGINRTVANRLGQKTGRFVLSSGFFKASDTGWDEMPGHGLFTGHLLRAFESKTNTGKAEADEADSINVSELGKYVQRQVRKQSYLVAESEGNPSLRQTPYYYFAGSDFFELHSVRKPVAP